MNLICHQKHFFEYAIGSRPIFIRIHKLYNFIKDHTQGHSIPYSLNGAITYFQFNINVLPFLPGLVNHKF